jgi:hypothetical protein
MNITRLFLFIFGSFVLLPYFARAEERDSTTVVRKKVKKNFEPNTAVLFVPNYNAQFPFGNMRDRFGFNSLVSMQLAYKMKKNWIIGAEGGFLFGNKVRENYILDNISNYYRQFINADDGTLINVKLQERGYAIKLTVGKVVPISEKYPDAGLLFITGFGILQHKIAIDVRENVLPQLNKTYRKGYDRMSNGPVISQFIGGIFMERKKFISLYGGVQFDVAFTQNRRPYDFYTKAKDTQKRVDLFLGIKLGWIIPVFLQASDKVEYYY